KATPLLRLVGMGMLTVALLPVYAFSLVGFGSLPGLVGQALDLLVIGIWVVGIVTIIRRRNDQARRWDLPAAAAMMLLLFGGYAVLDQLVGSALGFTESLSLLLISIALMLVPMLVLAG